MARKNTDTADKSAGKTTGKKTKATAAKPVSTEKRQ